METIEFTVKKVSDSIAIDADRATHLTLNLPENLDFAAFFSKQQDTLLAPNLQALTINLQPTKRHVDNMRVRKLCEAASTQILARADCHIKHLTMPGFNHSKYVEKIADIIAFNTDIETITLHLPDNVRVDKKNINKLADALKNNKDSKLYELNFGKDNKQNQRKRKDLDPLLFMRYQNTETYRKAQQDLMLGKYDAAYHCLRDLPQQSVNPGESLVTLRHHLENLDASFYDEDDAIYKAISLARYQLTLLIRIAEFKEKAQTLSNEYDSEQLRDGADNMWQDTCEYIHEKAPDQAQFEANMHELISELQPTADHHRDIKYALANVAIALLTAVVPYLFAMAANKLINGNFLFFNQTRTAKKLAAVEEVLAPPAVSF